LKSKHESCGRYGTDTEAMVIDELAEEKLYELIILEHLMDTLPQYRDSLKYKTSYLVARPKMVMYDECQSLNLRKLDEVGHELSDAYSLFSGAMYLSLILVVVGTVFWLGSLQPESSITIKARRKAFISPQIDSAIIATLCLVVQTVAICYCLVMVYGKCVLLKEELKEFQNIASVVCFRNENVSSALSNMVVELRDAIEYVPRDLVLSLLIVGGGIWGTIVGGALMLFKKKTEHLD